MSIRFTEAIGELPRKDDFIIVNTSVHRTDGLAKVTGRAQYTGDIPVPGLSYGKVLRSPYAHARINGIDAGAALARPGVVAVLTGEDIRALPSPRYGHAVKDHPLIALDKVRFVGEPVAVVIAEEELIAQEALDDVAVEYEELPALLTPQDALAQDAPLIHEDSYVEGMSAGHVEVDASAKRTNLCQESHVRWGDVDAVFARAAHVVSGDFHYPMTYAYAMEPYTAVADWTEEVLTIWSCAQHLYIVRNDVAKVFGLPLNRVRVITPFIGGGYGSKSYTKIEPLTAACSWKARRPVRLQYTIEESILTTRADDSRVHLETAMDEHGKVIGRRGTVYLNTGAYAENSPLVCAKTAVRVVGPYSYEAVDVSSYAVYTNTCPASSYRGFGVNQVTLAAEVQMDELAELVGQDGLQFKLSNLAESGERFFPKKRGLTADMKGNVSKLAEALGWSESLAPNHGRGMAVAVTDSGAQPVGRSEVRFHGDGSVTVMTGATEMGQGSRTVLAQIAAEEFGIGIDQVRVLQSDTAITPFARSTGADRTTTLEGRTVQGACREAKVQLRDMAAELLEAPPEDLRIEPTGVVIDDVRRMTWSEVIAKYYSISDMEVIGRADIREAGEWAEIPPFWEPCMAAVEVQVDPDSGRFKLVKLAVAGDVGLAINPEMCEGQDVGSAIMGLGVALGEELVYDGQQLANASILDYRIPRFSDVPEDFKAILVQNRDGIGPWGAKGIGDGPTAAMCAAISNAIYQAAGVRLREAPFTPERVWRALQAGGRHLTAT
ncbi:MAG: xanthine dehydrogenase family protein molybdopterin-binding subunit [Chloroflexota bacterium]